MGNQVSLLRTFLSEPESDGKSTDLVWGVGSGRIYPERSSGKICLNDVIKGQKKHINFFDINFLAPTQAPHLGPPEKSSCASFSGKERKKGTHLNFCRGDFRGPKRGPKQAIFSHRKFSLLFFSLPLVILERGDWGVQSMPIPLEQRIWTSHCLRDLSQFVGRTPQACSFLHPCLPVANLSGTLVRHWSGHFPPPAVRFFLERS